MSFHNFAVVYTVTMNSLTKIVAVGMLAVIFSKGIVSDNSGYATSNGTNVCCDGTVGDISMSCCANATYEAGKMICCGDQLLPLPKGQEGVSNYGCCQSGSKTLEVYNIHTAVCCGGRVTDSLPGIDATKYFSCCDEPRDNSSRPYIPAIFSCCQGKIIAKAVAGRVYKCCGDQLIEFYNHKDNCEWPPRIYATDNFNNPTCCGGKYLFNPETQICAYDESQQIDRVLNKSKEATFPCGLDFEHSPTLDCCGKNVFNVETQICCDDKIFVKQGQYSRCCYANDTADAYDVRTQFCDGESGVNNLERAVVDKYKELIDLCGPYFTPRLPDLSRDFQNSDYQVENASHICCNGAIGPRAMGCCGDGVYDPERALCCQKKIFEIPAREKLSDYGCCEEANDQGEHVYSSHGAICCNGVLSQNISADEYSCCNNYDEGNSSSYNTRTSVCCDGVVIGMENPNKNYKCCGAELIDADVVSCCGDAKYDQSKQICLSGYNFEIGKWVDKLRNVENNHTSACFLETYDTLTQDCCDRKIYTPTRFTKCCNYANDVYDVRTQRCSDSGIFDLPSGAVKRFEADLAKCGETFPPNPSIKPGDLS